MKIPKTIYNADLFEKRITGVITAKTIEAREKSREKRLAKYPIEIAEQKLEIEKLAKTSSTYFLNKATQRLKRLETNYKKLQDNL